MLLSKALLGAEILVALARGRGATDGELAETASGDADLDHPIREGTSGGTLSVGTDRRDPAMQHALERRGGDQMEKIALELVDGAESRVEVARGEMGVGFRAKRESADAETSRRKGGGEVRRDAASFDVCIKRGKQRTSNGLKDVIGVRDGGLEGVDGGEKGAEIVDGGDEVVEVRAAKVLDLGVFGAGEGAEGVEEGVRAAGGEGAADEGGEIVAIRDGGGEEDEVLLLGIRREVRDELLPHRRW